MRTPKFLLAAALVVPFVPACSQTTADTANPDSNMAGNTQSAEPAAEPQADPAQLQANDADLQALKDLLAQVDTTVTGVIAPIDAADKAHTELKTMSTEAKLNDKKLAAMISKTMSKGTPVVDKKVPKDKKADFEARLTALQASSGSLASSIEGVQAAQQNLSQFQAQAQTLFTNIEGRSNAMTTGTGAMFPEAQADVDEAAKLKADIDAKVQAGNTTLEEATARANALSEALGVKKGAGAAAEAEAAEGDKAATTSKKAAPAKADKAAAQPEPPAAAPSK